LNIVIEGLAEAAHLAIELILSGVREGRVAEVVDEGEASVKSSSSWSTEATVRATCETSSE
jgi:hypothetical protein